MGKGLAVFAEYGTGKRKVIFADPTVNDLLEIANKDGGNWIKVDELELFDVLEFECDEIYLGYNGVKYSGYCGNNLQKGGIKDIAKVRRFG